MTGAAKNTISKLLVDLGEACADYQDGAFQDLPCKVVEADEIWSYCYNRTSGANTHLPSAPGPSGGC